MRLFLMLGVSRYFFLPFDSIYCQVREFNVALNKLNKMEILRERFGPYSPADVAENRKQEEEAEDIEEHPDLESNTCEKKIATMQRSERLTSQVQEP